MGIAQGRARSRAKPIVYQATNLINGKRYIGVSMYGLGDRRAKHIWVALNGEGHRMPIARAIKKYGPEMIRFRVLSRHATYEEALEQEKRLIKALRPDYNVGEGGLGNAGWHHSEEQRRKISERNKGRPGYWKGKKLPEHVVQAIRVRMALRKGTKQPKRPESQTAHRRAVRCVSDGRVFSHAAAAAEFYGLNKRGIAHACMGRLKTTGGLIFVYADKPDPPPPQFKINITRTRFGKGSHSRPIKCVTDGKIFPSLVSAAAHYGMHETTIRYHAAGRAANTGARGPLSKYKFAYLDQLSE